MNIDEMEEKIIEICEQIGTLLYYKGDSIGMDDWDSLADYLAILASHICSGGRRIAAYAGIARRKANKETQGNKNENSKN